MTRPGAYLYCRTCQRPVDFQIVRSCRHAACPKLRKSENETQRTARRPRNDRRGGSR